MESNTLILHNAIVSFAKTSGKFNNKTIRLEFQGINDHGVQDVFYLEMHYKGKAQLENFLATGIVLNQISIGIKDNLTKMTVKAERRTNHKRSD